MVLFFYELIWYGPFGRVQHIGMDVSECETCEWIIGILGLYMYAYCQEIGT